MFLRFIPWWVLCLYVFAASSIGHQVLVPRLQYHFEITSRTSINLTPRQICSDIRRISIVYIYIFWHAALPLTPVSPLNILSSLHPKEAQPLIPSPNALLPSRVETQDLRSLPCSLLSPLCINPAPVSLSHISSFPTALAYKDVTVMESQTTLTFWSSTVVSQTEVLVPYSASSLFLSK